MAREWVQADYEAARDRAIDQLVAIVTSVAHGRHVTVDREVAREVRLRDARMWAAVERGSAT